MDKNNERICLMSCTLPIDDNMAKVWNQLAAELKRNKLRLIMLTPTINEGINFEYLKIPFSLDEFNELDVFLNNELLIDENYTALTHAQREIEWFNKNSKDWFKHYAGHFKCREFFRSIIQITNPSAVIAWQNSLPQSNILKRLAEEYSIPNLIMERGLLPDTFMLESKGNVALSDMVNNFSLRKIISGNKDDTLYENIKNFYRTNQPFKYAQKNYHESLEKLNEILISDKPLVVYFANVDSSVGIFPEDSNLSYRTSKAFHNSLAVIKKISETACEKNINLIIKLHPHDNSDYSSYKNENTTILRDFNYQLLMEKGDVLAFSCTTLQAEALLYEKPILLFCNTELTGYNIAYEVGDEKDLPNILDMAFTKTGFDEKLANSKKFIHWISQNFLFAYYDDSPVINGLRQLSDFISSVGFFDKGDSCEMKLSRFNDYIQATNYKYPYRIFSTDSNQKQELHPSSQIEMLKQLFKNYEMNPADKELLEKLGKFFIDEKQYLSATRFFQKALIINSDKQLKENMPAELLENISEPDLSNSSETSIKQKIEYAELLIEQSNFFEARNILESILAIDPNNVDALNDLGVVELLEENYNKAVNHWIKVIEIDGANDIAIENLAYLDSKVREKLTGISDVISYEEKLKREVQIYENQQVIHNLPPNHHTYTSRAIDEPLFKLTGSRNFYDWCASEVDGLAERLSRKIYGLSIGCGNGDSELEVLSRVKNKHLVEFTGVDINPVMIDRAKKLAAEKGFDMLNFMEGDFNSLKLNKKYDFFFANHSLHHVIELENLFEAIEKYSNDEMIFLINDMIGRNGHKLWDGTKEVVDNVWSLIDKKYKLNAYTKQYDKNVMNIDCSQEGFEGIRAQDILPLLLHYFDADIYLPFSATVSRFIDRVYGHNFNINDKKDLSLITSIIEIDLEILAKGQLAATQAFIKVVKKGRTEKCRYIYQSPETTIAARNNRIDFSEYITSFSNSLSSLLNI